MDSIHLLRHELDFLFNEYIKVLKKRKNIIEKVIEDKNKKWHSELADQSFPFYDPKREFDFFANHVTYFKTLSILELASLSFLIEGQIKGGKEQQYADYYPSWSSQEHLKKNDKERRLASQINPLLLYFYAPEEFNSLNLKEYFSDQFNYLINS